MAEDLQIVYHSTANEDAEDYSLQAMRKVVVLGPQRLKPTLDQSVAELGVEGQIAAITCGWRERESEDDELAKHLSGRSQNLHLYRRTEQALAEDSELRTLFEDRRARLREAQQLYRLRLDHVLSAAQQLMRREPTARYTEDAINESILDIRRLDDRHIERVTQIHAEFPSADELAERKSMRRHIREIKRHFQNASALAIAGGHVAVLINRLRMFKIADLVGDLPILAWSAGAMALAPQIVLYHDFPPQGAGNAEVLEPGLGLYPRVLPLPHARRRLNIDDPVRIALFARRFDPLACVALDEGSQIIWDGGQWSTQRNVRLLSTDGTTIELSKETGDAAKEGK